jgi:hypothetical protein
MLRLVTRGSEGVTINPNVLVWTALDLPLRGLDHRDLWHRPSLHVATNSRRTLVCVPDRSRVANS